MDCGENGNVTRQVAKVAGKPASKEDLL
jgi:hypothetical protein